VSDRCGVVVAHGPLAEGLLSALARVAGPQENLWALTNEGLARDALLEALRSSIESRSRGRQVFLFSDMSGGSCGQACKRLLAEGMVRAVFYGINLPLLIEFVFLQDQPVETMISATVSKSRAALGVER
jgi:mannose/fructose-specific phosphotransferase system component IIA